ncbi:eamA-like transporter family protein [Sarocladium implicatum]|nr:eamA-like transporter family protein [Sarocladium implicatum]
MSYGTTKTSSRSAREQPETTGTWRDGDNSANIASTSSSSSSTTNQGATAECDQETMGARIWRNTKHFYSHNIGLVLIFFAQIFASIMSMTTKLLATGFETKIHALQIVFVRMLTTTIIGSLWMWYKGVPHFPIGPPGVRGLLVIRGMAGSIGIFGLYYSLSYLDVSEATVITFLVPTLTTFVCWVALNEPFTGAEASAGIIALIGVLFIARPVFLFGSKDSIEPQTMSAVPSTEGFDIALTGGILPPVETTPLQRSIAVCCAILGAFCAATAYATIRVIGKRAHSLVSVNYFSVLATLSSFLVIMIHPDLHFEAPQGTAQWLLLFSIGLSGFMFQILFTEGLQREKAGRATNLMYTQLIFSLIIDYTIWGVIPPVTSLFGSLLIVGAAVWVSLQSKTKPKEREASSADEESRLLRPERDQD